MVRSRSMDPGGPPLLPLLCHRASFLARAARFGTSPWFFAVYGIAGALTRSARPRFVTAVSPAARIAGWRWACSRLKMVCRRSYLPASAAAFSTHFPKFSYPLSDTQSYVEYNSEKKTFRPFRVIDHLSKGFDPLVSVLPSEFFNL